MHLNPKAAPGKGEREGVQGGMCSNIRSLQTDRYLQLTTSVDCLWIPTCVVSPLLSQAVSAAVSQGEPARWSCQRKMTHMYPLAVTCMYKGSDLQPKLAWSDQYTPRAVRTLLRRLQGVQTCRS